jgi:hypothetical protein
MRGMSTHLLQAWTVLTITGTALYVLVRIAWEKLS